MNLVLGGAGGAGGGIFASLSSVPPVLIFFGVLGGVALGLWISNELSAKRIQKRQRINSLLPQITPLEQKYAGWMTAAINSDLGNLEGLVKVSDLQVVWQHVGDTDPYITLRFDVSSSSVFIFDISESIDGHIRFEGSEFGQIPEVTTPINQLKRSNWQRITIRQGLSQKMKEEIEVKYGNKVEFGFGSLNISVQAKLPDGSDIKSFRLPLPAGERIDLPTLAQIQH